MELKEILAISKLPGLYQIVASRDNGLIVTPLGEEKRKFVASRQHMFTPLENITVYTNTDSVELTEIFKTMKTKGTAIPDPKADDKTLRAFFIDVVPEHDQQRVYVSDIKKMIKWFVALDSHGLFVEKKEEKPASGKEKVIKEKSTVAKEKVAKPKESTQKAQSKAVGKQVTRQKK
jgi:hypothetical protein